MRKQLTVITGGSSGLGLACASCMAHETTLVLCARGEKKLAEAKKNLEAYGADVILYPLDASNRDAVQNAAAEIAKLGDIVHVIHTAGVSPANTGGRPFRIVVGCKCLGGKLFHNVSWRNHRHGVPVNLV